jgi:hypothetical protein
MGTEQTRTCWACPAGAVRGGANELEVTLTSGGPVQVFRIDLALKAQR